MLGKLKPTATKSPGQCHTAGKLWSKDSPQVSPGPGQCADNHSTEHPDTEKETECLRSSVRPPESNSVEEHPQDEKSEALSVSQSCLLEPTSYVTWGKSLNLSDPQAPELLTMKSQFFFYL